MKTPWPGIFGLLVAATILAGLTGAVSAQVVELSGTVTKVTDFYAGDVLVGSPVGVRLDLTAPMVDLYPENPEWGMYRGRPMTFRANGRPFPMEIWPNTVVIVNNQAGRRSGLMVWADFPALDSPSVVVFGLVGGTDLLTSDSSFPVGIPMDEFFYREGEYLSADGSISWSIDAYDVRPNDHIGAPEPSTYGLVGAVLLSVLAFGRRHGWGRRG